VRARARHSLTHSPPPLCLSFHPLRVPLRSASNAGAGSGGGGAAALSRSSSASAPTGVTAGGGDYRRLTEQEIAVEQNRIIHEVANVLEMPPECARTLLLHFAWNKDRLFDRYYADPRGVRREAGIQHLGVSAHPAKAFMCTICLDDCEPKDGFGLGCKCVCVEREGQGESVAPPPPSPRPSLPLPLPLPPPSRRHIFCRSCWSGFLESAVSDEGGNCIFKKCPSDGCGEAVTMATVRAMAPAAVADKWALFELKHFVTISKDMAWCPGAGCNNAFVARTSVKTAACSCGMRFCFRCSRESHQPVDCEPLAIWLEKCGNESETANWILANTKKCPKCTVRIEKNQGWCVEGSKGEGRGRCRGPPPPSHPHPSLSIPHHNQPPFPPLSCAATT
jgi:ariadne-1